MRTRHELDQAASFTLSVAAVVLAAGCNPREAPREAASPTPAPRSTPAVQRIEATEDAVAKAREDLKSAADRDRRMRACLSFEDFKATVYKEPFAGGKYIVNGDTAIVDDKRLKEFFDTEVKPPAPTRLILNMVSGMDTVWNQDQKRKLTYCVSDGFGPRRAKVLQDIESATGAWEQVAAVDFVHDAGQDANCTEANTAVVFDVRPVNVNQEYLARAFFPNEPRAARNVLIDESALTLPQDEVLQLAGVLRHELGHTLGFRHEHTRPESGTCFEDRNWRPLSTYDAFSVMHYPQCNGQGDWSLTLTDKDKSGAACVYGPAAGFAFDVTKLPAEAQAKCRPAQPGGPSTGQPQSKVFDAQSVGANVQKAYGPFAVTPGTTFQADISGPVGTGDPDLYVRFTNAPRLTAYDCRPYLVGPNETCALTVPAAASQAHVMVHGFAPGDYRLEVKHVPPVP